MQCIFWLYKWVRVKSESRHLSQFGFLRIRRQQTTFAYVLLVYVLSATLATYVLLVSQSGGVAAWLVKHFPLAGFDDGIAQAVVVSADGHRVTCHECVLPAEIKAKWLISSTQMEARQHAEGRMTILQFHILPPPPRLSGFASTYFGWSKLVTVKFCTLTVSVHNSTQTLAKSNGSISWS